MKIKSTYHESDQIGEGTVSPIGKTVASMPKGFLVSDDCPTIHLPKKNYLFDEIYRMRQNQTPLI
jgi:hypothetical protein